MWMYHYVQYGTTLGVGVCTIVCGYDTTVDVAVPWHAGGYIISRHGTFLDVNVPLPTFMTPPKKWVFHCLQA